MQKLVPSILAACWAAAAVVGLGAHAGLGAQQLPSTAPGAAAQDPGRELTIQERLGIRTIAPGAERTWTWESEVVDAVGGLPVQHDGRLKPFGSVVRPLLYQISHKRSVTTPSGERLTPVEWALDVAFFPDQAADHEVFRVRIGGVLEEMGLADTVRRKADRYSYRELEPGLRELFAKASEYADKDANDRDAVESQVVDLAQAVRSYDWLRFSLAFARYEFFVHWNEPLKQAFPESPGLRTSEVLARGATFRRLFATASADEQRRIGQVMAVVDQVASAPEEQFGRGRALAWFAPLTAEDGTVTEWASLGELVDHRFGMDTPLADSDPEATLRHVEIVRGWEKLHDAAVDGDLAALRTAAAGIARTARDNAAAVDGAWVVESEVAYYDANPLWWSWAAFLLGFVVLSLSWLLPGIRALGLGGGAVTVAANVLLTWGLVHRCVIMGRAPVANLYETFLFITCTAVWLGLALEAINRRRISLSVAAVAGVIGLWGASVFEVENATDTMAPLQAVLISNFWLGTHVVSITLGYAVALFSGMLAHVWLFGRLFGVQKHNAAGYSRLSKMIYGTLCFSLFFTVVGTILGGIWAAESWGRFWGWDPKENGAFLIAVAQLFILHGRMGGYFRDWSVAMLAVATNMVVAFSWFYVNVMSVGLHSYGFDAGIAAAVWTFWYVEGAVLLAGVAVYAMGLHTVRGAARVGHEVAVAPPAGAGQPRPVLSAPRD